MSFPARGKIVRIEGEFAVFNPAGTNYELHLKFPQGAPPVAADRLVWVTIRATARKVWSVPSGGNFVTPIFGPPKIAQGRVKELTDRTMVLHAGVPILVTLPAADNAYDLENGPMVQAGLINVTLMPGATIELAAEPATV